MGWGCHKGKTAENTDVGKEWGLEALSGTSKLGKDESVQ